MPGLLNIHFAFPETFRKDKRKDTKVSKYYVITEKHEK